MFPRFVPLLVASCFAAACQSSAEAGAARDAKVTVVAAPQTLAVKSWALSDAPPQGELMVVRCDYEIDVVGYRRRSTREVFVSTAGAQHTESIVYVPERPSPAMPSGTWTVVGAGDTRGQQGYLYRACTSPSELSLEFSDGSDQLSQIVYTVRRESLESARARVPALRELPDSGPWKYVWAPKASAGEPR